MRYAGTGPEPMEDARASRCEAGARGVPQGGPGPWAGGIWASVPVPPSRSVNAVFSSLFRRGDRGRGRGGRFGSRGGPGSGRVWLLL